MSKSIRSARGVSRPAAPRGANCSSTDARLTRPPGHTRSRRGERGDAGVAAKRRPERANCFGVVTERDDSLARVSAPELADRRRAIVVGVRRPPKALEQRLDRALVRSHRGEKVAEVVIRGTSDARDDFWKRELHGLARPSPRGQLGATRMSPRLEGADERHAARHPSLERRDQRPPARCPLVDEAVEEQRRGRRFIFRRSRRRQCEQLVETVVVGGNDRRCGPEMRGTSREPLRARR